MLNEVILREHIYKQIINTESAKGIFDLFRVLGYPENIVLDPASKRKKSTFEFKKDDEDRINEVYSILTFDEKLPVFLLETTTLQPSFVRSVSSTFDKQYLQFLLIFTVDYSEITFVFPDKEKMEAGKHKLKLTKLNVEREDVKSKKEYYSVIQTLANMEFEENATWREVWRKWKKAFSVERVTEEFFERYKDMFFKLRTDLHKQGIPNRESHEFTLQFLNRIMFIYFIAKKDWLEKPKFVDWLWSTYRELGKYNSNEFYEKWLKQVFLKAFNNRANEIKVLPDNGFKVISNAPYLNGGLFRENSLDSLKILITDKMFQKILEFFESYNFTIKEDMPLESEVAVDPQMIGYVYESLANVAEEIYDRNDLGIFYTPRVEVDFMCRRSLVEYLSKNLSDLSKDKFYHLIFDPIEERDKIEAWFTKNDHWRKLEDTLNNLSVVDPACGSGAFLVGMLNVVSEVYRMIYKHTGTGLSDFALKNRVIQYSLYGVDVMPWAIHAAELRLWLQLIVETDFKLEELRQHPLLPNLNLNLRVGDSLVQEIGGISFNLRSNNLNNHLKRKLDDLKQEKRKYFENSPTAKFKTPEEVREEEIRLFEEIIDERVESLSTDIQTLQHNIKMAKSQVTLAGEQVIDEKKANENQLRINANDEEIEKLKSVKNHLDDPEKKPFVWDIDFAEIFGDKGGFDIVIGNPPYVTRTFISPPNRIKSEVTKDERDDYKRRLINSVNVAFSEVKHLSKMSDYYIYFYFHGLGLLNDKGTFCFITSNSWLDVDYGKELQEFLCKYVPIIAIYDNRRRSFTHADINTIIALLGAPNVKQKGLGNFISGLNGGNKITWPNIRHIAKFVMFKKAFEDVVSSKNLIDIENIKIGIRGDNFTDWVKNISKTNDYRVFSLFQEDLLEDGWEYPVNHRKDKFTAGGYTGNKWGGKFLRAPDIFYTILERGENNLLKLSEVAKVRIGIMSGLNEFFWLKKIKEVSGHFIVKNGLGWEFALEKEFVQEAIKSPRELDKLYVNTSDIKQALFICNLNRTELERNYPLAFDYILTGEKEGFSKRPFFNGRKNWWDCGAREKASINCNYMINDMIRFYFNEKGFLVSDNFHQVFATMDAEVIAAICNSTLMQLMVGVFGRVTFGGGLIKLQTTDAKNIFLVDPKKIDKTEKLKSSFKKLSKKTVGTVFEELGIDPNIPIIDQEPNPLPDRAELDNIIFDELGLTQDERKEVYWSVCELVKQRIDKAKSLRD